MDTDTDIGWGEAKGEINLLVHGVPLAVVRALLADPGRIVVGGPDGGTAAVVGLADGRAFTAALRRSGADWRVLSLRPATAREWRAVARLDGRPFGCPTRLSPAETVALDGRRSREIARAAASDPDNPPLGPADLARGTAARRVRRVRDGAGLSPAAFAAAFRLDPDRLAAWEAGTAQPDGALAAYLAVIAREPDAVRRALAADPAP